MNISHDSNNGQQAQVAIHISKLDGVTDGILILPTVARKRFADHCDVRGTRAVALVEDSPPNQRNSENLEVSIRSDAEIRYAEPFLLLEQCAKCIRGLGNLILCHQ